MYSTLTVSVRITSGIKKAQCLGRKKIANNSTCCGTPLRALWKSLFGFYFQCAEVFRVKLGGVVKAPKYCDRLEWAFLKKNSNEKKKKTKKQPNPYLQKGWSRWSRNLKAIAQTFRTFVSKEVPQHTDPGVMWLVGSLHGSPTWGWKKVLSPPQLLGPKSEAEKNHISFAQRGCRNPPKGFIYLFILEQKGEGVTSMINGLQFLQSWSIIWSMHQVWKNR